MNHFCVHCGGLLEEETGVCSVCERVQGVPYEQPCVAQRQSIVKPIGLAGILALSYCVIAVLQFVVFG